MHYHKKFGTIVMVASVFIGIMTIALSQNNCYGDTTGFDYVMLCMSLFFFEEIPGIHSTALFAIQAKYAFVFCGFLFGLGFLWYQGAIKAPLIKALAD